MPPGGKNDEGKAGRDVGPIGGMADENGTLGDALSKVGFEPAKVGRKIVSQGKRRESLKRRASKEPDRASASYFGSFSCSNEARVLGAFGSLGRAFSCGSGSFGSKYGSGTSKPGSTNHRAFIG